MRAPAGAAHRVLPFWVLQAGQLGAAGALVDLSIHLARPQLLLALACLLAGVTLLADAPLGVVRVLPRKPAAILAVAVSVAAVPAMLAPPLRPGVEGAVIVVFVAVGIARLATLTRLAVGPGPETRPGAAPGAAPGDHAGARSGGGGASPVGGSDPGERPADRRATGAAAARRLGVEAARLAAAAERRRPELERAARHLARRAGRATGRVQGRLRDPGPDGDGPAEPPAGPVIGKN